jgi:uncharacterized membrane protein
MKGFLNFVKTTAVGGFLVVLPAALILFLAAKAVGALVMVAAPILGDMTARQIWGVGLATLLSILFLFLLCFVAGMLVHTRFGRGVGEWLEGKILQRLPGYVMLKSLTQRFSGEAGREFVPVLVDLYGSGSRTPALLVEEHDDGRCTIFVPLAPTPTIGQVHFVAEEQVARVDAPLGSVLNSLVHWGMESGKFLQKEEPV